MRVLYVIDSLARGGAETSLVHIAPAYRDLGIELHVAFLRDRGDLGPALVEAGASLHPVALHRARPRQLLALVRLIRLLRPDLIHTTLWEADVLGRGAASLTRTPAVSTLPTSRAGASADANPGVPPVKLRLARGVDVVTARLVARFHAVSETVADEMAGSLHVRRDRIEVIPRARRRDVLGEPSASRRSAARRALGLDDDRPMILAVGRHEHQKGLDVLVAAIPEIRAAVPDAVVLVAGHPGRVTAALHEAIDANDLRDVVTLLGTRNDVPDLLVAADAVAVPSRFEGMPGAVLEAMALARPVVATDLPTVREAIDGCAFELVPVDDAGALARALVRCLGDPAAADRALESRRRFDELFTPRPVAERMRDLYRNVLDRTSPSRTSGPAVP